MFKMLEIHAYISWIEESYYNIKAQRARYIKYYANVIV